MRTICCTIGEFAPSLTTSGRSQRDNRARCLGSRQRR
jgi:hypothetical protein